MSYQDKFAKLDHGDPLGEDDPADGPDLTEGQEFELLRDYGMKAEKFRDKEKGKRYAAWLAMGKVEATEQSPSDEGAAQHRFRLKVEDRPEVQDPSEAELFEAVDALTPLGGPGFLALEAPGGHYAQAAGGDGMYAVESREWLDDRFESFRHYVAGKEGDRETYATIPTNGFQVTVRENECLNASDVKRILSEFLRDGMRSPSYEWRDNSDSF